MTYSAILVLSYLSVFLPALGGLIWVMGRLTN
jgi:hypothetical protein